MTLLSLQPSYVSLIQKPYCCAVACLQMILYRNGCGLFDQETLAIKFGVKIAPADAAAFSAAMPIMTKSNCDEGIQTIESGNQINSFFDEMRIPLRAQSFKRSALKDIPAFLNEHLGKDHDIWVEYHTNEIYSDFPNEAELIHDGLIESFDSASQKIALIDPMPNHRQRNVIALEALERSISKQYGRETGFIVIEKR